MEEEAGTFAESCGGFGGEILAGATTGEPLCHFGMAVKIVVKAGGDVLTLRNDTNLRGNVLGFPAVRGGSREVVKLLADFVEQEGIMGAAEDDGVDEGVLGKQFLKGVADEVVGSGLVELATFDQWHPHGTCLSHDGGTGIELLYLQIVGLGLDSAFGGEHTDMVGAGELSHDFGCGAYDSKHTVVGGIRRKVLLLDGAEGLGGSGVAPQNDQRASQGEELLNRLEGELIHHVEGTCAVWGTRVVAKVDVVILRHPLAYAVKNGQTSIA